MDSLVRRGGGGDTWTDGGYDSLGQALFVEVEFGLLSAYGQTRYHPVPRPKSNLLGGNAHVMALFNRVSSELMVLGFVAFMVWACYQGKMFTKIADDLADTYTSSPDYYYIYNFCHDVHIWLFLSMVWHFIISTICIYRCCTYQKLLGLFDNDPAKAEQDYPQKYEKFKTSRKFLIDTYSKGEKKIDGMDENFDFGLYLALNLDRILSDFYNFHVASWLLVCFIKVIEGIALGILAARSDWKWWYQLVELVVISSLSPVVMLICYFFRHSDLVEGKIGGCGEKWDVEMWVSRLFQGLTFTLSYETMSYLAYKGFWKASDTKDWPEGGKLSIIICVLLFLQMINTYLLPLLQRTLTLKYALPPYVDEENLILIKAVISRNRKIKDKASTAPHDEDDAPTLAAPSLPQMQPVLKSEDHVIISGHDHHNIRETEISVPNV